ncbi:retrotransposon protein, putative, ty1-copia subclass [Tanacetum coccineum]
MLMTIDLEIQKTLEHVGAYDMVNELKTLYVQQADQELLQTVREFHACKQEEGQSASSYEGYDGFCAKNYNMHSMGKTVNELHDMLKLHEQTLPPKEVAPALHAIRAGRIQKTKRKNRIRLQRAIKGKAKRRWAMHLLEAISRSWPLSSIYAVTNKITKLNLDSALLWHCRLGHINKKRIEKLQHGLLKSTDIKYFEKCVACMSGKMARKPYSHQVERAKDLLGLIHTDVCDPFKIMSIQGAYYFVTFTDEFSRYGYVYLLKHKNEVFETFKMFQKEVENQLGKTIKSLRSDRGGEYMS